MFKSYWYLCSGLTVYDIESRLLIYSALGCEYIYG